MQIDSELVRKLATAADGELYGLLGLYSLCLARPEDVLQHGREGFFRQSTPHLFGDLEDDANSFRHRKLESFAKNFLQNWRKELQKAICQNGHLRKEFKGKSNRDIDLMVAAVAGSVAAHLPQLAPFSGLLIVLGVIVARSGLDSFCKTLEDLDQDINK